MRFIKLTVLLLLLAPLAMGTSEETSCWGDDGIIITAPPMEELTVTPEYQLIEGDAGFAVAIVAQISGGQAPYYAVFYFGDGTEGQILTVWGTLPYAATTHVYQEVGSYEGAITVYDSRDIGVVVEFHVHVTEWNSGSG